MHQPCRAFVYMSSADILILLLFFCLSQYQFISSLEQEKGTCSQNFCLFSRGPASSFSVGLCELS